MSLSRQFQFVGTVTTAVEITGNTSIPVKSKRSSVLIYNTIVGCLENSSVVDHSEISGIELHSSRHTKTAAERVDRGGAPLKLNAAAEVAMTSMRDEVQQAIHASALIAATAALHTNQASLVYGDAVRDLGPQEITQLKNQGNRAKDWSQVRVVPQFTTHRIWNNRFLGPVVLGTFSANECDLGDGVVLPVGVYDSTLSHAEIADDSVVHRVGLLNNSIVREQAVVVSCTSITCSGNTSFGCGQELALGIETGGREVHSYAEITIGVAESICKNRDNKAWQDEYEKLIRDYVDQICTRHCLIETGAIVKDCGPIVDCYIGSGALVNNARLVENSCLLSNEDERTVVRGGAWVRDSILQWGAVVDSMGLVDKSVLCEHSLVERHGKLTKSILGPNSCVGEGEVRASLVGPFVAFHHQALLIAAMWPEGKGNVGYGANIGSNHTSRVPDQEIWCGEGTFFGLGVNVKFPADLTGSPYSILASGITCLSQKVAFPFSLINSPTSPIEGLSPSINEIFPGWVLSQNIYMLRQNEVKFANRNQSCREEFVFEVLRSDIIKLMIDARERLSEASGRAIYTDQEIPALGKNYVTDQSVKRGIATYDFYIGYYARKGLKDQLILRGMTATSSAAAVLLQQPSQDCQWDQQRMIIASEDSASDVATLLRELVERERTIAESVERCKAKDDVRGARIIPDYTDAHTPARQDNFVLATWSRFEKLESEVNRLLAD